MDLALILESLLFASQKPLSMRELRDLLTEAADKSGDETAKEFRKLKEEPLQEALDRLEKYHNESARSYRLVCVAGAWQFVSQTEYAPWLKALLGEKARPARLSQPSLETLTIIAYRQPVTRAEVEQIRGVAVDGVVATLLERGLIENAGRAEVVGRPMTYKTTSAFLEYFGLRSLNELPAADELRRIPVERPPALLTVENGLVTAAPGELAAPAAEAPPADESPAPEEPKQ
jgi:segregation and condensation protein B